MFLGVKTDTMDNEGKIIENKIVPNLELSKMHSIISGFVGYYRHYPPMYSAKKINGVRLYKLARKNKVVKRDSILSNISSPKDSFTSQREEVCGNVRHLFGDGISSTISKRCQGQRKRTIITCQEFKRNTS